MTRHAEGSFTLASWDEKDQQDLEGEGRLTRAHVVQDFAGDLQGTGTWDALMCYGEGGAATYVGYERIVGRLAGRSGSFVLQTLGGYDGEHARTTWSVVPGSGTGELTGLRGQGSSAAPAGPNGTYTLDYDLG